MIRTSFYRFPHWGNFSKDILSGILALFNVKTQSVRLLEVNCISSLQGEFSNFVLKPLAEDFELSGMSADLMKLENGKHVFLIEEERFSGTETLLKAEVEKGRLRKLHMCADDRLVACAEAIVNALILSPRVHSMPRDSGFYRLNINDLLQRDFPISEENLPVLDRTICFTPADSPEPKIWINEFEPTGLIRLENLVPLQREDWVTTVAQRYLVRGATSGKIYRLQNDEILFWAVGQHPGVDTPLGIEDLPEPLRILLADLISRDET